MAQAGLNYEINRTKILLDWPFKYDLKKSNDSVKYDTPENIKPIDQWLRQGGRKSRWTVPLTKAKGLRGGRNSPSPNTGGYFGLNRSSPGP